MITANPSADGEKMKQIANMITACRIAAAVALIFIVPFTAWLYAAYILGGITDMIDGTVARKFQSNSRFGKMFDSAADFVFMAVCTIKLLPQIQPPMWVWAWTVGIAVIRFISVAYSVFRFQKLKPFHTLLNKTTGVFLFYSRL